MAIPVNGLKIQRQTCFRLSFVMAASIGLSPAVTGQLTSASGATRDIQEESARVDTNELGQFDSQRSVGEPMKQGNAAYDPDTQAYRIAGSGKNMWFDEDQFHFVWKRMDGDFIVRVHAAFLGEGVDPHRKLGVMIRSTLETSSPHVNAVVHGDGLTSMQFRRESGSPTEELKSTETAAEVIQLERKGDRYTMSVARFGQPFVTTVLDNLELGDQVYVGLFVCSHNPEVIEQAVFKNVRITTPAPEDFVAYRDYIGSRLETLDVDTGQRQVLWETSENLEAPNWARDGESLIFNSQGRLFRFSLRSKLPTVIDTGFADKNNNDHVLSFDGTKLGISHHDPDSNGQSVIYTLPATGGHPNRVTAHSPSYLHGWSPDGKWLVYTGERDGEFDIYRIAVSGGEEIRLTTAPGLDDGSEFSPDGKHIYFNSARTGTMQIWRMKPDGSEQQQITHDEMNNWFPHVSPDGKRVVFLSFSKDVGPEDHPFYKHVYLRMLPIDGGQPKVVAYVYGGQGTINVPSWAPDSRHLAFVSNSQ